MVLMAKKPPANAGDTGDKGLIPGSEDILEEGIATHSSILAWGTPWTEEPSGVSIGSQKSQIPSKRLGTLRRKTENWLSAWRRAEFVTGNMMMDKDKEAVYTEGRGGPGWRLRCCVMGRWAKRRNLRAR